MYTSFIGFDPGASLISLFLDVLMSNTSANVLTYMCHGQKSRFFGDGNNPTFNRNPYNGYINPYYWVDDHPLLCGNNGSLDPTTHGQTLLGMEFCRVLSRQKFRILGWVEFLVEAGVMTELRHGKHTPRDACIAYLLHIP